MRLKAITFRHGNTERRALELKNIKSLENLFFIGIRSIEPDEFEFHKENKIQVKTAYDCYHTKALKLLRAAASKE